MQNISNLDIDDPNAIVKFISACTDGADQPTYYQGVEGTNACVETETLLCEVGYDPHEDGILWVIGSVERDDSMLYSGGWAPGDRETAEREIIGIITTMNGGTVAEWQPSPEEQALIAAIKQRNAEYIASLLADRR